MIYAANPRVPSTMALAVAAYRRDHRWLRLIPRRWIVIEWTRLSGDWTHTEITGWRWKTRADRDLDRRLSTCCCHPDQPRGHR